MSLQDPSVARALEGYGLKEPRVVGLLEASSRNENFLVETASGTRYVLRRYRRNQDERRVAFQLRFQRHVHEQGFPTALVVDTTAGRPYLVLDGIPWALFEFIEGEEYDFSRDEQAAEAGRRLAELHSLAASFQEDEIVVDWYRPFRDFWKTIHAETTELHDVFSGKGLEEELSFRAAWSQALTREWPIERVDALPQGWVHGDYHRRNCCSQKIVWWACSISMSFSEVRWLSMSRGASSCLVATDGAATASEPT